MRKKISLILICALILSSFAFVFGETPKDVAGTKYEDAVKELVDLGIISGYTDGSFKPNKTITRAEACVMVVKVMDVDESELEKAASNVFPDMADHEWAKDYVNYAADKGVITGYPDGTFKPAGDVTYAEMASMLVRALGYKVEDLKGNWPNNFMDKAKELGLLKGVYSGANDKAIRGDVALMSHKSVKEIEKEAEKEEDKKPDSPLSEYSGRAYGILLDVATALDDEGKVVDEYEFLFGENTLYFKANKKGIVAKSEIETWLASGAAVGLQMNDGVVTKIGHSEDGFVGIGSPSGFENLTTSGPGVWWAEVQDAKNNVIETKDAYVVDSASRNAFTILKDASIYVAKEEGGVITGYKSGSFRDIKKDKFVRIYSVTGKNKLIGEIVLVRDTP